MKRGRLVLAALFHVYKKYESEPLLFRVGLGFGTFGKELSFLFVIG